MTHLLMQWLNDEIQLSQKVSNLESDFANGYLFGELLQKYNQQLNFNEFQNKQLRQSKLRNFTLLQPTFKTLKIKFDTQTVEKIINQQPGLAEQILYSLKMALEKVNDPADVLIHAKTGKYNAIVPLKVIQQPRDQFDKMESQFFERRLNEMNKAQKAVNQDAHLQRFEQFKKQQDTKIQRFKSKDETEQRTLKEEMRKIQLNKLQRNMAFMEDWNQKGIENWKKNQDIRKKNLLSDQEFHAKQDDKKQNRLQQLHEQTKQEMLEQIAQFETNVKGVNEDDEEQQQYDNGEQRPPLPQQPVARIHQSKVVAEFLRKERDKRRRKMIVDQAKQHGELARREQAVLEKIKQQSRQEQEILYEVWRAYQCKAIIQNNRYLRDEKYKQKQELNVINIKYKEEEMLKQIKQEFVEDVQLQLIRERELRIEGKLQIRKQNYETCQKLVEQLFEFAEQCNEYLQNTDSGEIGQTFLDECNKLFIAGKELPPAKRFRTYDPIPQLKLQAEFPDAEDQKQYLATSELQDYIFGRGMWIPHHPMQVGDGPHSGDPTLDEKFVPAAPINNYYLGNIVRILIEQTAERPPSKRRTQMPNHLPFRCALVGYAFCGKKSISELLARKYGITVLSVENVIQEFIEYYRECAGDNNVNSQVRTEQSRQSERVDSRTQSRAVLQFVDQEKFSIAKQIHDTLLQGGEISDELITQAICLKIRHTFPVRNEDEAFTDYQQSDKPQMVQTLPRKSILSVAEEHTELENIQREDLHKRNMVNQRYPYCQGYLLYDYPHSYQQAKLLELYLSGYQTDDEVPQSPVEKQLEVASLVVQPTPTQIVPRKPIEGGLPLMIYLQMQSNEDALKRALGRRYDDYTHSFYHLESNIPPVDNAPLVERLQPVYEINNMEQQISDKNMYFDQQIPQLQKWYMNFAHTAYQIVRKEIEIPSTKQTGQYIDHDNIDEQFQYAEIAPPKKKTIQEKIPKSIQTFAVVDSNKRVEEVFYNVDQLVQQMLEISEIKVLSAQQEKEYLQLQAIQEAEEAKQKAEQDAKWVYTDVNDIICELEIVLKQQTIPNDVLQHLRQFWDHIQNPYLKHSRLFFRNMREQRDLVITRLMDIQKKYIDMLTRHDEKFYLARNYQVNYNQFVDENPDIIEEEQTKEELHQRVDDLSELLGEIVDQKKEDALEDRKKIMESQWIEGEMERFLLEVQRLLQAELDRTMLSCYLLQDYYAQLDGREFTEPPEQFSIEIATSQEGLPAIESPEDPNQFPRLDKLLSETLRILNGEEEQVVDDKNKKGGKVAKKEDKKGAAPPKKGVKEVEEIKREATPLELEAQKAINTEKAIMRYRIHVIKENAIHTLKNLRSQAFMLYKKMDEWAQYTHKCELDAINVMCVLFRQAIEEERKIQKEIQLQFVDVRVSHEMLNFFTPVPPPLQAHEPSNNTRLSISQLYYLIEDLRAITSEKLTIEVKQLILVLTRKTTGLMKEDLCETLRVHRSDWLQVISKLQSDGYVPVRKICTYFILLASPILDRVDRDEYQAALSQRSQNGQIDREGFISTEAWFDSYESLPEEDNTNYFDRAHYIKELLFFVHKDPENELMNINSYLDVLEVKSRVQCTYYEYLFSQ